MNHPTPTQILKFGGGALATLIAAYFLFAPPQYQIQVKHLHWLSGAGARQDPLYRAIDKAGFANWRPIITYRGGEFLSPGGWSFFASISDPGQTPTPHEGYTVVEEPIAYHYMLLDNAKLSAEAGREVLSSAGMLLVECDFGPHGGLSLSHTMPQMVPEDAVRAEVEAVLLRIRQNLPD